MGILGAIPVEEIRARGSIRDSDVLRLRQAFQDDPAIRPDEAEVLLGLDECCPVKDPSWAGLLVEMISDFTVNQLKPEGYLVAGKGRWLIERAAPSGRVRGNAALELLATTIEKARWTPPSLAAFTLDQVRQAVATGAGPLRSTSSVPPGTIAEGDIAFARRIIVAGAREGFAITRPEADALLAINASIASGRSSLAWTEFFVRTLGNGVLAAMGRWVPRRQDVVAPEPAGSVIDRPSVVALRSDGRVSGSASIGEFAGRMIADGAASVWASRRPLSAEELAMERLERQRLEIVTGEAIELPDAAWLASRLDPLRLDENQLALLAYLRREANGLPDCLSELAARAMIAA